MRPGATKQRSHLAGPAACKPSASPLRPDAGAPAGRCPSCGQAGVIETYSVDEVPVHSLIQMNTRREALAYPMGSISLALCPACGFITNTLFDISRLEYSPQYEDTQGFSGRFNTFLAGLVKQLVERYGVRGKRVLEIGCGKGEFLALLCQSGDNEGIGIDPACDPQRIPAAARRRMTIIPEMYSSRHGDIDADVICCRHTLEHIPRPGEFLRLIRRAIGGRGDVLVFFELPDLLRVLNEAAFWDIYYEHCSYFTPGSLARLFRASGFDIVELYLNYAEQYVMLFARPAGGTTEPSFEIEDDLAGIPRAARAFCEKVEQRKQSWRRFLEKTQRRSRPAVLWGAGSKAVAFLTTLKITDEVRCVVDINPYRQGKYMPVTGQRIIAPRELASFRPACVIAMNPVYVGEIRRDLGRLALRPHLLAV